MCVCVRYTHRDSRKQKRCGMLPHTPDSSDPWGKLDHWVVSHPTFCCTRFILCTHYFYNQRGQTRVLLLDNIAHRCIGDEACSPVRLRSGLNLELGREKKFPSRKLPSSDVATRGQQGTGRLLLKDCRVGVFVNRQGCQGRESLATGFEAASTVGWGWGQIPREKGASYMVGTGLLPQHKGETEAEALPELN